MTFETGDLVRVTRLVVRDREVDGPSATPPQPRIGDDGSVVDQLGDGLYLVEHRTDDGRSLWMAEFQEEELELIDRPES